MCRLRDKSRINANFAFWVEKSKPIQDLEHDAATVMNDAQIDWIKEPCHFPSPSLVESPTATKPTTMISSPQTPFLAISSLSSTQNRS